MTVPEEEGEEGGEEEVEVVVVVVVVEGGGVWEGGQVWGVDTHHDAVWHTAQDTIFMENLQGGTNPHLA